MYGSLHITTKLPVQSKAPNNSKGIEKKTFNYAEKDQIKFCFGKQMTGKCMGSSKTFACQVKLKILIKRINKKMKIRISLILQQNISHFVKFIITFMLVILTMSHCIISFKKCSTKSFQYSPFILSCFLKTKGHQRKIYELSQ